MLTPQEVSEHAFAKASFGGYNMAMVDEFLDALTRDYTALYKETAVLKSKMKVLVDKVEDYRSTEDAMRKALLTAQRLADEMVQEAERKKASLLGEAEAEARKKTAGLRQEVETEAQRLTAAQNTTAAYVAKLKEMCAREVDYLNHLDQLVPKGPDPVVTAAHDIDMTMQKIAVSDAGNDFSDTRAMDASAIRAQEAAPVEPDCEEPAPSEPAGGLYDDIAAFVAQSKGGMQEQHFEVTLGQGRPEAPAAETPDFAERAPITPSARPAPALLADDEPTRRIDFDNLQFGKDYEIK